ncbi:MAG: hypothetical protein JSW27_17085 [Phycisphaerales bacterium]|nr:MAG: hypothetical protein JSW27_17085 [Phycisphaerales bacterium]
MKGELGYFGLASWWSTVFTADQRAHIEKEFQPAGLPPGSRPLTTGQKRLSFPSAATLLTAVAGSLRGNPKDRTLAAEMLHKAEQRAKTEDDRLGLHFTYQETIHLYCKWRDHFFDAPDLIFGACHKQIAMAPEVAQILHEQYPRNPLPIHAGFQMMVVLLEKEESYAKAIEVCKQARTQGWKGNWTWRIGCLAKKLGQQGNPVQAMSPSGLGPV